MNFSIAIDGPAGAGKSSIAKQVAKKLGFIYVDTGAMYRAMALYFLKNRIQSHEEEKISHACSQVDVRIEYVNGEQQVILNNENVNDFIRTEEVGNMASACSKYPEVRLKLVELQRNLAAKEKVIMDGRDIGSYVLPDANIKIYLTASSAVRAKRRHIELVQKGISCDLDKVEQDIIARDKQDMSREFAPLCQAPDAILLDTSEMTIEEVIERLMKIYRENSK